MTQFNRISLMILYVLFLIFTVHGVADSTPPNLEDVELFDWIGHKGVEDPSWSDERIFKAIQQGLSNDEADIVNATIGAMAWIAAYADLNVEDRRSTQRVARDVGSLPGMKDYLINRWDEAYRENSNPWIGSQNTKFVEIRNSKTVWKSEWAWLTIPAILATFFRGDPDIIEILWQAHNPNHPELLLSLLNVAQIETEEANNFRVQILFNQNVNPFATALAVDSLGRFRSDDGLAALVDRLGRKDTSNELANLLLSSIGAYGDSIKPYQNMLNKTTKELGLELPESVEVESPDHELLAYLLFMVQNGYENDEDGEFTD
ncbi:MAG: hypothetical protein OXH31_03590 [Gammaproteobacteria bacterium]|nr:hypothetical protein [Gammaproteobacteria bacterium]